MRIAPVAVLLLAAGILWGDPARSSAVSPPSARENVSFQLTSPSFGPGQPIPDRYTCQGEDNSPELQWSGAPAQARSFVLIMDDPDAPAGTWVHWVLYDLPANQTHLPSLSKGSGQLSAGLQGRNSFKRVGYGGPCPPPGHPHRYFFRLYALSVPALGLPQGATRQQIDAAMHGKVLAETELMGVYGRKS